MTPTSSTTTRDNLDIAILSVNADGLTRTHVGVSWWSRLFAVAIRTAGSESCNPFISIGMARSCFSAVPWRPSDEEAAAGLVGTCGEPSVCLIVRAPLKACAAAARIEGSACRASSVASEMAEVSPRRSSPSRRWHEHEHSRIAGECRQQAVDSLGCRAFPRLAAATPRTIAISSPIA